MILLDGLDKHDVQPSPKLVAEASSSSVPVTRPITPTPSLPPDYESSQAQLRPTTLSYPEIKEKRTRRRRCRRYTIYILAAYFFLTVVIGLPILVVKLKKSKSTIKPNPYQSWADDGPPPNSINLGDAPLRISAAKSCNAWNVKDRPDGSMFMSQLDYHIPVNGSVYLNTNISYASNATYLNQFAGSLLVTVNDDASVPDGVVSVTMHTTSEELTNSTHVCMMETGSGGGLYIFTPQSLNLTDALTFNITLLLPQSDPSPRYIPQLLCHLPHFQHTYGQLDPYITFDSVIFGGAMSGVYVESLQASSAVVKASTAEIRGSFKVSQQLSLETVSAPINADVHLYNDATSRKPTYMHIATGNSILNANVTLYLTPPSSDDDNSDSDSDNDDDGPPPPPGPNFLTHVETFNAPLNVAIVHDVSANPVNMQMRAANNLGNTRVTLDNNYAGTFDVNTMFAQADVLTWDGTDFNTHYDSDSDDSDDDSSSNNSASSSKSSSSSLSSSSVAPSAVVAARSVNSNLDHIDMSMKKGKVRMYLPSLSATTTTAAAAASTATGAGRCLEYDLISSSQILGWVGVPPRPPPPPMGPKSGNQSHVEVVSSLTGAQLILQP